MGSDLSGDDGQEGGPGGDGFAFDGGPYCAGGGHQGYYGGGGGGDVAGFGNVGANGGCPPGTANGYGSGGGGRKNDCNTNASGSGTKGSVKFLTYEQPTIGGNINPITKIKRL